MSELQKKWAKARLGNPIHHQTQRPPPPPPPNAMASTTTAGSLPIMPPPPPSIPEFNELDEMDPFDEAQDHVSSNIPYNPQDDDSSSASSVSSTGTVIPSPGRALFARPHGFTTRTLDPIPWTAYFERELFLPSGEITHHAYLTSPTPPSGKSIPSGPLFVMHHGAGSSGLSFAVLSAEVRKRLPSAGILAIDARGHGSTITTSSSSQDTPDLSLGTLARDLYNVILLAQKSMGWEHLPPIILVGHSLGGAVVTELASLALLPPNVLLGYAVLDVVEGSAMDALQSMQTYLSTRPTGFWSLKDGIEWHVRSRTVRNAVSARASVPGLLVEETPAHTVETGAAAVVEGQETSTAIPTGTGAVRRGQTKPWRWRTDLASTQPFWEGWFVGLSKKFLGAKGGKMLLLAGTDRLDTELTIGQMQGKYALQVFPEAGHFIHEDLPEKTAIALVDFHRRNDRSALVLPPKVSELLAQGKRL
ncbi:Alpha/Beta hydrolase protein [Podospora australis]|uniref:Protein phosphatase methylesterase 1 n=1 Tax=Podospora australis TaxID=1536484 RepID=A0AAN7AHS3_9PEZI|nr:Alpha/Beta hydrolase protein [Podospora australis]